MKGPARSGFGACAAIHAGVVGLILAGSGIAHATPLTFTDPSDFLVALSGAPTVVDFDDQATGVNEMIEIDLSGATGGTFSLGFEGQQSPAIPYDANAWELSAAMQSLPGIGADSVVVTGDAGGPWEVEYTRGLGGVDMPFPVAEVGGLTGSFFLVLSADQNGSPGTLYPSGTGAPGVTFDYNLVGPDLGVKLVPDAISGTNALGGFRGGDSLTLNFDEPVNAVGMYLLSSAPVEAGEFNVTLEQGGTNERQRLELGGATGGTFTIEVFDRQTAPIAPDATTAELQAALTALPVIGPGGATVSGTPGDWLVEFSGPRGATDLPFLGLDVSGLSGPFFAVLTTLENGAGPAPFVFDGRVEGADPADINEIQTLQLLGSTGGTFTIDFGGLTTVPLAYDASAYEMEVALRELLSIGPSGVQVAGAPGDWEIEFTGRLGAIGVPFIGLDIADLTGAPVAIVTEAQTASGTGPTVPDPVLSTSILTGANEIQQIQLAGADGGTFRLTVGSETTDPIPYDATAAQVQAALGALGLVTADGVVVTGDPGGPWVIEFTGPLATTDLPFVEFDAGGLTGPFFAILTTLQNGVEGLASNLLFVGLVDEDSFSSLQIGFGGPVTRTWLIDDLMFATGPTDGVGIAEPGIAVLLGVGLLSMAHRRRST